MALLSALLAFVALPQVGFAQQAVPTPMDVQPAPDSVQAMMTEYQNTAQRYTAINNEAFTANSELQTRETEINDLIMSALLETHPLAEAQMARLDAIEAEAYTAQQAQDVAKLGELITEANNLQADLQAAQEIVLQRDDVKSRIESFEAALLVAMLAIDPETDTLRMRLDELYAFLNAAQGGAGGGF
jgi:hypothetical protein